MVGLVGRSRRRYGGYIVHVGIVMMFLGFAGQGFKLTTAAALSPGQTMTIGHFMIRHDSVKATDDGAKQMITGHVTVFENGKEIGKMYPARWFYRKHEQEPTTEVAIRRRAGEDLYIVMQTFELSDQSVNIEVHINPLVNWIWLGFAVMAMGTGLCLLPERTFAFAVAKFPAEASGAAGATTMMVLLLLFSLARPVMAQHVPSADTVISAPRERAGAGASRADGLHVRHVRARAADALHLQRGATHARRASHPDRSGQGQDRDPVAFRGDIRRPAISERAD